MTVLRDWTVELQFDDSKVDAGLRKLDKKFSKKGQHLLTNKNLEMKLDNKLHQNRMSNERALLKTQLKPISHEARRGVSTRIGTSIDRSQRLVSQLGGKTDSRSLAITKSLTNEIQRLEGAQKRLNSTNYKNSSVWRQVGDSVAGSQRKIRSLGYEVQQVNKQFNSGRFAANGFKSSLQNLARGYVSIFAAISAAGTAFRTIKDFERINATMLLASGNSKQAAVDMNFVKETANRLGSDVVALADAFAGFNVSAVSAGLTMEDSKKIFSDLAVSVQATGLDAHRSGLAFLAFKQMLAGPVIQAQEMNQVVEQMPQFTGIARRALKELGHEGENFRQIIATGTVQSEKFVRVVAKMMQEQAVSTGAAEKSQNNLIAAQNRMTNSLKYMAEAIARSGLIDLLSQVFKGIERLAIEFTPLIQTVVVGVGTMGKALSSVFGVINELLDALGFEHGLASVLVGIGAYLAAGALISNFMKIIGVVKELVKWIKALAVTSVIAKAGLAGPLAAATSLAAMGAAAYGADALFKSVENKAAIQGSGGTQINQKIDIRTTSDAQEIKRTIEDHGSW